MYQFPKAMEDDPNMFPSVARFLDAMLCRVDPSNPVLIAYLKTINPSIETGILLPKSTGGPSKKSKGSKKVVKASPSKPIPEPIEKVEKSTPKKNVKSDPPSKKIDQPVVEETSTHAKETMPSKSDVLKRLKKMAHGPRHSPERSSSFSPKGVSHQNLTRKPQLTRKGVVIREIPTSVSPVSKKRRAEDMVKRISKKKKRKVVEESLDKVVPESDFEENGKDKSPLRDIDMGFPSPMRDSPIKLIFEEIGNLGGSVKTSDVERTTNQGDHSQQSTPKQTVVVPPGVSQIESLHEEVRTLGITVNIFDMDENVNMGNGVSNTQA